MGRSLGLAAYRAFSRRSASRWYNAAEKRPPGLVLWIHAAEPANLPAIQDLGMRICSDQHDLNVLITLPDHESFETARANPLVHGMMYLDLIPSEHPEAVASFWSHWAPDMAIWTWGNLRPTLLAHVHDSACPIALIDADVAGFDNRRDRWLPELSRKLLEPFIALLVRSNRTLRRLETLGVSTGRIDVTPPLQAGGHTLPCEPSDLADLSDTLAGRPVWFASHVHTKEVAAVVQAHRKALRMSHRLLLVINPAEDTALERCKEVATEEGFSCANWSAGEEPDDTTQILLAPDRADLGLFYRIAPVTFMGSSLVPGNDGRNPFEPAALGSAVLNGPNVRRYQPFYSRLAKAGAARLVKDADTLGETITNLIAPDQAATMAHAGWDVVSEGAYLTDRVITLVHETLETKAGGTHARP